MNDSVFKEELFEEKKVFITGGATGMGLGFARSFLEHGADVFIASLIFIEDLAQKVVEVVSPQRDRLKAAVVFPYLCMLMYILSNPKFNRFAMD